MQLFIGSLGDGFSHIDDSLSLVRHDMIWPTHVSAFRYMFMLPVKRDMLTPVEMPNLTSNINSSYTYSVNVIKVY